MAALTSPVLHYDFLREHQGIMLQVVPVLFEVAESLVSAVAPEQRQDAVQISWEGVAFAAFGPVSGRGALALREFERTGHRVYVLEPTTLLLETDLRDISPDKVSPPTTSDGTPECFYVALANSSWGMWGGERTKWHPITGFYVHPILEPDGTRIFSFYVWGACNAASTAPGDDAVYSFAVALEGTDLETAYTPSEQRIKTDLEQSLPWTSAFGLEERNVHLQSMRNVFHCAINLMLYLSSEKYDCDQQAVRESSHSPCKVSYLAL